MTKDLENLASIEIDVGNGRRIKVADVEGVVQYVLGFSKRMEGSSIYQRALRITLKPRGSRSNISLVLEYDGDLNIEAGDSLHAGLILPEQKNALYLGKWRPNGGPSNDYLRFDIATGYEVSDKDIERLKLL